MKLNSEFFRCLAWVCRLIAYAGYFLVPWAWLDQGVMRGKEEGRRRREKEKRREGGEGRVAVFLYCKEIALKLQRKQVCGNPVCLVSNNFCCM